MPKISDYPEVTSPADDQYMVVDGSNGTKKVSIASLKNKFNGGQSSDTPDVTLQTKAHEVKAMVFPVLMYGCESWTLKKAEHQRIDAFEL